jgi:hypothetical protein
MRYPVKQKGEPTGGAMTGEYVDTKETQEGGRIRQRKPRKADERGKGYPGRRTEKGEKKE